MFQFAIHRQQFGHLRETAMKKAESGLMFFLNLGVES
jgi:hypothetical protein